MRIAVSINTLPTDNILHRNRKNAYRLKHLCEAPNANVLFTTFTRTLSENLVESINKLGGAKQKYTLMNIDRVLHDVAERYKSRKATKSSIFRVIILIGINDRYFPTQATAQPADKDIVAQKEDLSSKRSLLYVAITRARQASNIEMVI